MPIKDVKIAEKGWGKKHWRAIEQSYSKAPHFKHYRDSIEPLFYEDYTYLSDLNRSFISHLCLLMGIRTRISFSSDYELMEGRNERLIGLCKAVGAVRYLSGPAAKSYLDAQLFRDSGIEVEWADYTLPPYRQLHGPFQPYVSILDLIFNEGQRAKDYL